MMCAHVCACTVNAANLGTRTSDGKPALEARQDSPTHSNLKRDVVPSPPCRIDVLLAPLNEALKGDSI